MNATAQQTEPNTHEMVVIHRIFRREFPLLAGIVLRASDGDARRAEALRQVLGQLDGIGDQLTDLHRRGWLDGRSGLARTALVPFGDDEVILEEPVEPGSRHLGLTRTAVQLQQDRALGAPASHQQPLPYAPQRQWLESRNAARDGSPLRIAYRPSACRRPELRENRHKRNRIGQLRTAE
jgi:hypothetical protein